MADTSRWDQRTKVSEALADDIPVMEAALQTAAFEDRVAGIIADSAEGELLDWVIVAVHAQPDGQTTTSIQAPADRTDLHVKGLLHDALWAAAHRD